MGVRVGVAYIRPYVVQLRRSGEIPPRKVCKNEMLGDCSSAFIEPKMFSCFMKS